jgi:hypothetical protein
VAWAPFNKLRVYLWMFSHTGSSPLVHSWRVQVAWAVSSMLSAHLCMFPHTGLSCPPMAHLQEGPFSMLSVYWMI